jgi:hypothetical protein
VLPLSRLPTWAIAAHLMRLYETSEAEAFEVAQQALSKHLTEEPSFESLVQIYAEAEALYKNPSSPE